MKIDEIKDPQIRALAWKYRKANKDEKYNQDTLVMGFNWLETKEKDKFWAEVYNENPVEITEKMKQDHPEIFNNQTEKEMENKFNFKVGDKVTSGCLQKNECIRITAIGNDSLLGISNFSHVENKYSKMNNWKIYQPKKVKLQKFYCKNLGGDGLNIRFFKSREEAEMSWEYVYTEQEFKDKFDVEL